MEKLVTAISSDNADSLKDRLKECDQTYPDVYAEVQRLRDLCYEAADMIDYLQWKLRDR